jgi:hypothetical protein
MPLVTAQQFQSPSILQEVQQGIATRGEIQRQGMLSREEANRQRLSQLAEAQAAEQKGLLQKARGVEGIAPEEATQQEAINLYYANNPAEGEKLFKRLGIETEEQKQDLAAFADTVLQAQNEEEVNFLIDERVRKVNARGGDPSETLLLKDLMKNDPEKLRPAMQGAKAAALTAFQREQISAKGRSAGGVEKAFAPVTLVNPKTGEKILVNPVFDAKTGKSRLEKADIPEGFEISRETKAEERAAEIATVGAKKGAEVTGKKIATRRQVAIDEGLESSEGFANIARARALLDEVKTGGFSAASLRAKQLFGVEGANEGELSNRLGKAVLSQLRTTFGAAFTAQEGAQLTRIEAGFGKSTEGNKRLLDQLKKMIEKKSKEGIKAAVASEDFDAAQRIKDNLAFSLETEAPLPQGVTEDDISETMRIHGVTRQEVLDRLGGK